MYRIHSKCFFNKYNSFFINNNSRYYTKYYNGYFILQLLFQKIITVAISDNITVANLEDKVQVTFVILLYTIPFNMSRTHTLRSCWSEDFLQNFGCLISDGSRDFLIYQMENILLGCVSLSKQYRIQIRKRWTGRWKVNIGLSTFISTFSKFSPLHLYKSPPPYKHIENNRLEWLHTKNYCRNVTKLYICAADFSLLNLPEGKSLGRSKPATNS